MVYTKKNNTLNSDNTDNTKFKKKTIIPTCTGVGVLLMIAKWTETGVGPRSVHATGDLWTWQEMAFVVVCKKKKVFNH